MQNRKKQKLFATYFQVGVLCAVLVVLVYMMSNNGCTVVKIEDKNQGNVLMESRVEDHVLSADTASTFMDSYFDTAYNLIQKLEYSSWESPKKEDEEYPLMNIMAVTFSVSDQAHIILEKGCRCEGRYMVCDLTRVKPGFYSFRTVKFENGVPKVVGEIKTYNLKEGRLAGSELYNVVGAFLSRVSEAHSYGEGQAINDYYKIREAI